MVDAGTELNQEIAAARAYVVKLQNQMDLAERKLEELEQERAECRQECQQCNDCSMCLG